MAFTDSIKEYFTETGSINKRRLKKFVLAAPFWILIIAIGLMSTGIIRYNILKDVTTDEKTASVWEQTGATGFRHMSVYGRGSRSHGAQSPAVYVDQDISLGRTDILDIRKELQNIADSAVPGNKKTGLNDDGTPRGWEDCFSTFVDTYVEYTPEGASIPTSVETQLIAVEGNYKIFHPFMYMSGGFLPEISVDVDQIVINDVLAWRLFSSYDVTGRTLQLYGQNFTIIGVVAENTDSISRSVGAQTPRAYIYFRALETLTLVPDENGNTEDQLAILTYEAMLPELVKGVAKADMNNALPNYNAADPKLYVVSNTGRYSVFSVWDFMMPLGEMQTRLEPYEFPYWERAAQLVTMHLFVDIILVIVGSVLLLIGIVTSVLRWKKFKPEEEKADDNEEEEAEEAAKALA